METIGFRKSGIEWHEECSSKIYRRCITVDESGFDRNHEKKYDIICIVYIQEMSSMEGINCKIWKIK